MPVSLLLPMLTTVLDECSPHNEFGPMLDLKSMSTTEHHCSSRSLSRVQHRKSNESTLKWLEMNYEFQEGICLPRCLLYQQYLHYMHQQQPNVKPIGAAAFGKLVRQKFPKITTRRLGTRGQSKYHYYGISIQTSSIYFSEQRSMFCNGDSNGDPPLNQSQFQLTNSSFETNNEAGYESLDLDTRLTHSGTDYQANNDAQDCPPIWSSGYVPSQHYRHSSSSHKTKRRSKMLLLKSIQAQSSTKFASKTIFDHHHSPINQYHSPLGIDLARSIPVVGQQDQVSCESGISHPMSSPCERGSVLFDSMIAGPDGSTGSQGFFQSNYPSVDDFVLPPGLSRSMLSTFLLMYRSHSQRILDTFQLANVDELHKTVTHFWCEMPAHLGSLMAHPLLAVVVECVDSLLYRTIEESLSMLSLMPDMSGAFVSDIELILSQMPGWLTGSILGEQSRMRAIVSQHVNYPSQLEQYRHQNSTQDRVHPSIDRHLTGLVTRKLHLFSQFALAVRMQLKFFKIAKECRHRVMQPKHSSQMTHELETLCLEQADHRFGFHLDRSLFVSNEHQQQQTNQTTLSPFSYYQPGTVKLEPEIESGPDLNQLDCFHASFDCLLQAMRKSIDFDQLLRWARTLVQNSVLGFQRPCLTTRAQTLLYAFNCYVLGLMRELTINAAKSLDHWNLVFVCLKEFLLIEISRCIRYERQSVRRMALMSQQQQHTKTEDPRCYSPQDLFPSRFSDGPGHLHQEFVHQPDQMLPPQATSSNYLNSVNRDQIDGYNMVDSPSLATVQLEPNNCSTDTGQFYYGQVQSGQSILNLDGRQSGGCGSFSLGSNHEQSASGYSETETSQSAHWSQTPMPNSQQQQSYYETSGSWPGYDYNYSRPQVPGTIECNLNGACINLISNINCYYSQGPGALPGLENSDSQPVPYQPHGDQSTGQMVTCVQGGNVYTCLP